MKEHRKSGPANGKAAEKSASGASQSGALRSTGCKLQTCRQQSGQKRRCRGSGKGFGNESDYNIEKHDKSADGKAGKGGFRYGSGKKEGKRCCF